MIDPVADYARALSEPEGQLLAELDRETHLRTVAPRMISGHLQGRLLTLLTRMLHPRRVLEIGTFTGYSALCIAEGLDDGATLDTIEVDDEQEEFIRSYFARSPHGHRITLHIGSALELAPSLGGRFDLVYVDGDKREYPAYYRMLMGDEGGRALVGSGSVLLADNTLWYGKVADPACRDPHTEAVRRFNRMAADDPRVEQLILPLRDGINLIRVK